jgi:Na+-translocating ferredoxin:NAD+ oxidoreductase RnfG subunit
MFRNLWTKSSVILMAFLALSTAVFALTTVRINARIDAIEQQLGPRRQATDYRMPQILLGTALDTRVGNIEQRLAGKDASTLLLK